MLVVVAVVAVASIVFVVAEDDFAPEPGIRVVVAVVAVAVVVVADCYTAVVVDCCTVVAERLNLVAVVVSTFALMCRSFPGFHPQSLFRIYRLLAYL